ncbi:deaminase domain-containing protein [Paenibacillus sp. FSL H8-0122]|uniref:deaminase domain-containing protein n=1 Tax=Paenibacillus sp. FSL H8-0122 TaxID=2954510 RepID=UPI0030F771DA
MASAKLIFDTEQVRRLQTKIGQVSQDTNRLYLQMKGQAGSWSGIPVGDQLMKAQMLMNELTAEAEKLEDIIRTALKGVEGLQAENARNADLWAQQFSAFAGMLGNYGTQEVVGQTPIPPFAQKVVTNLIHSFAFLPGRDELDSDPAVKQLGLTIQTSGPGSLGAIAAESKLQDIFTAWDQIAKAQMAYKVYESFGNKSQMNAVHLKADEARQTLASLGIEEVHYTAGKDLSMYFKQPALQACDYDPSILTRNVPLPKNESYLLLLRMAMEPGDKGGWAKGQLQTIHAGGINLLIMNPSVEAWRDIVNKASVRQEVPAEQGRPDLADWESQPAKKDFIDKYLVDPLIELFTGEKPQPKTQLEQVLSAQFYGMQIEQQFVLSDLSSEFESTLRGAASADRISEVFGTGTVNVKTGTPKNRQIEPEAGITGNSFGKIKALDELEVKNPAKSLLDDFDPGFKGVGDFAYVQKVELFQVRTQAIRNTLSNKYKNYGNVAVADVNITGLKTEFKAHSRIHQDNHDGFSSVTGEGQFPAKSVNQKGEVDGEGAFPRNNDTERKILEDIAHQLGNNKQAKGQIDLYTELPACRSCSDIIIKFRQEYPNIKLNVYSGEFIN